MAASAAVVVELERLGPLVLAKLTERFPRSASSRLAQLINGYIHAERRSHPHGGSVSKRCPFGVGHQGQVEHDPSALDEFRKYVEGTRLEDLLVGDESKQAVRSRLLTQVGIAFRQLYQADESPMAEDVRDEQDRRKVSLEVERLKRHDTVMGVQVTTVRDAGARFVLKVRPDDPGSVK